MNAGAPKSNSPGIANEVSSAQLIRWTGYCLLALSVLDAVAILFPARFMDPAWELEAMGNLIDRVPVPLMGLALVYYRGPQTRHRWERHSLRLLSWFSLVVGIFLILMVPLLIGNTFRVREQVAAQLRSQVEQQLAQALQLEQLVATAKPDEIETILKRQSQSTEGKSVDEMKGQLVAAVAAAKQSLQTHAQIRSADEQQSLFASTLKYTIAALISGSLLFYCWRETRWARANQIT